MSHLPFFFASTVGASAAAYAFGARGLAVYLSAAMLILTNAILRKEISK